ncbi:GNAT family N-acetyltransferase [Iningainema tapete]|uniref:GNAT family N-acetyltransferase n=1 Tax=Iningainema tapete BLCC-T55 TaxID=2748662 RepID=A0A8J6XBS5_9CYAN|nr:GNAT family N-acetyltransferase [Iningainema tapete]MBD2771894.1 GNAT family N-acetyltransferase [Iningainema tapete BLCC-T55]
MNTFFPATLQFADFTMKPLQLSDLDTLAAIWLDTEVTKFLPSRGKPIPREQTEKSLAYFVEHWQKFGYGIWAIEDNSLSSMIGYCGLRYLEELKEVEVLYALAKAHWGKGIATVATKAAIKFGFDVAKLDKIIALAFPENTASRRVMEKAGLRYEKQVHIFGLDAVYYFILR